MAAEIVGDPTDASHPPFYKGRLITDPSGHTTILWRPETRWVVQTDDVHLRRRIRRALRRPIYTRDPVIDADGQRLYCQRIWVYPGDECHAHEVLMNVGALGLHDVAVVVVVLVPAANASARGTRPPTVRPATMEEVGQLLDQYARRLVGMSGDDYLEHWRQQPDRIDYVRRHRELWPCIALAVHVITQERLLPNTNREDKAALPAPSLQTARILDGEGLPMARTLPETRPTVQADAAAAATLNGHAAALAEEAQRAFELTDAAGHRAYAWPSEGAWIVESDDAVLRRRVQQALKKPLWVREDVVDEEGVPWSTRVKLQPSDPRYANRLHWKWDQLGLGDVQVRVVTLPDRQPVRTTAAAVAQRS